MSEITEKQVKEIINLYSTNSSILETAKATGVSTVKIRKILITEGMWESDTSIKIRNLLKQGLTTGEIAETLHMSVKNVQAYMPYERGIYKGEDLSLEAIRSERYRNRMKNAASMQVVKRTEGEDMSKRMKDMINEKTAKIRGNNNDKPEVLRLHLELDMKYVDDEELQMLKKYGSMKQAISRDILVPADITLHALHYAILRMFGWQNGHLHNFSIPENIFNELTENQFSTWSKMAGVYFKFPTENYEDIYWDDDYREGESIRSWMKKKYTGPYRYKGYGEHYLVNQMEVQCMFSRWDEITVHEFDFKAQNQPKPYHVKLKEATIDQVTKSFADVICYELIERLPLVDVLCVKNKTEVDLAKVRKYISTELSKIDVSNAIEEYRNRGTGSMKREQEFLAEYNIPTLPITEQLRYSYDYGDGWEVLITCENSYKLNDEALWKDMEGKDADVSVNDLEDIIAKCRPICIAKDGIELVDDVGGIGGFCRMLQIMYECNIDDQEELEEKDSMQEWANMMGWTGRRINPKQTL